MESPNIVSKAPVKMTLETGEYYWCSCGKTANHPFCDGSHKQTESFSPVHFVVEEKKDVFLCSCKHTNNQPFCDGTHKNL